MDAAWSFRLPDNRWMVARAQLRHRNPLIGLVLFLGGIALAVAIGAYPVVRGLTRRLDGLVKAGLVTSNGEARRQIKGGGLRINDVAVSDEKMILKPADLTPEGVIKLSLGKKRHVLLKPA